MSRYVVDLSGLPSSVQPMVARLLANLAAEFRPSGAFKALAPLLSVPRTVSTLTVSTLRPMLGRYALAHGVTLSPDAADRGARWVLNSLQGASPCLRDSHTG